MSQQSSSSQREPNTRPPSQTISPPNATFYPLRCRPISPPLPTTRQIFIVSTPPPQACIGPQKYPLRKFIFKHLKWICAALTVIITALTLITLQPTLKSVLLARKADAFGAESNGLAAENNRLAEWSALLSFKQDCEARAVYATLICHSKGELLIYWQKSKHWAPNCSSAVAAVIPPPPHARTNTSICHRLTKRSLQLFRDTRATIAATGWAPDGPPGDPPFAPYVDLLMNVFLAIGAWHLGLAAHYTRMPVDGTEQHSEMPQKSPCSRLVVSSSRKRKHYLSLQQHLRSLPPYQREGANLNIFQAAASGCIVAVERLLRSGVSANLIDHDDYGKTPLTLCMAFNREKHPSRADFREIARLLLSHGADPDLADSTGTTALMYACEWGFLDEVRLLLTKPQNVNQAQRLDNVTALHITITGRSTVRDTDGSFDKKALSSIVRLLVENGADINCVRRNGRTPLAEAMCLVSHYVDRRVPEAIQFGTPDERELVCTLIELGAAPSPSKGCRPRIMDRFNAFDLLEWGDWLTSAAKERLIKWKEEKEDHEFAHGARRR